MANITEVSICNLALAEIGTRSSITSLTDGSTEAFYCNLWYDQIRQNLLRTAQWGFARFQGNLTQIGDLYPDNTSPYPWLFEYTYPADCIKIRYVLCPPVFTASGNLVGGTVIGPTWLAPSRSNRFIVSSDLDGNASQIKVVLTNVGNATGVYTKDITDPTLFDPLYTQALISALAYKLVIPLSGNAQMRQAFQQSGELAIAQARAADGEAIPKNDHTPDWMIARGIGSPFGWGILGDPYGGWGQFWGGYEDFNWGA